VFIAKQFRHYKYDYREEWLRVIRLLSTKQEKQELQQNSISVLADIVETTEAVLWVKNNEEYKPIAFLNFDESENQIDANSSMIKFLRQWQWVIDLNEYTEAPDIYQQLELPEWIEKDKGYWLIVPLMLQTELYGFVILGHPRAPMTIGWEERDLLLTTGRQITSFFALMDMEESLAETRQFEAFSRLSAFVVHDLKNLVAQLSLIVSNAGKHKGNPDFMEDTIDTVENAVEKMGKMLLQLRKGQSELIETVHKENINLDELLQEVVKIRKQDKPRPLLVQSHSNVHLLADRDRLTAVLVHLVQNAQEATPDNGKVEVRLSVLEQDAVIEIVDTGCGMEKEFIRDRLFKPFDTTKGNAGMGIGAYESREHISAHKGSLKVNSTPGQGTTFTITLPLAKESQQSATEALQGDIVQ
jgi:putative PEP-CTERM system histidine kinase